MNEFADFTVVAGRGFFRPVRVSSLDDVVALIAAAISHARAQGLSQLLVDTRRLTGHNPPDTFQRYYLIHRWLEAAAGCVQVALIVRPDMLDPERFAIRVAENRGFVTDAFLTEEEALAWLDAR